MFNFGLSSDDFWRLTPAQFSALADRFDESVKRSDLPAGIIASTVANCNRRTGTKMFAPKDFMPKYGDEMKQGDPKDPRLLHGYWKQIVIPAMAVKHEKENAR